MATDHAPSSRSPEALSHNSHGQDQDRTQDLDRQQNFP